MSHGRLIDSSTAAEMSLHGKFNMSDWTPNSTTLMLLTKLREKYNMTTIAPPENESFYPMSLVLPFTFIYALIFVSGVVGNVSTCIVIARNRSMHTATNYYLFSLAISDMLLLVSGLPPEMYRIWSPNTYIFGEAFCILQGFAAETSANATVLTITAFTIERYLAICHPFLSYTMSKLSRAIRLIFAIWTVALCLAIPQAIQFGVQQQVGRNGEIESLCTVVSDRFAHAFEISTFVFFVGPMTLITVLYILIGCQLRQSEKTLGARRTSSVNTTSESTRRMLRHQVAQHKVVRMLIAVVTAFFVCWAPFHAQRLLAVYLTNASAQAQHTFTQIYTILMYVSGVLYFLSTTINPLLYSIMSNKFRKAFQKTFCRSKRSQSNFLPAYRYLVKVPPLVRTMDNVEMNVQQTSPQHLEVHKEPLIPKTAHTAVQTNSSEERVQGDFLENRQNTNRKRPRSSSNSATTTTTTTSRLNSFDSTNTQPTMPPVGERWRFWNVFNFFRIGGKETGPNVKSSGRTKHSSITISNSSLQDLEETEITSYELVKYMREVNEKL